MRNRYYIYEHWRPDTDICFYVGRGTGKRATWKYDRNQHHKRIVAKLAALGMCIEVRMYACNLTLDEARVKERERIAFWRGVGAELANQTAGGDGVPEPTDEVRAKMRAAHKTRWTKERRESAAQKAKAQWRDPELRARYSATRRGLKISDAHLSALLAGNKRSWASSERREKRRLLSTGENNPFYGKRHPPEILERIAAKKRGVKQSAEARAKKSAALKAWWARRKETV